MTGCKHRVIRSVFKCTICGKCYVWPNNLEVKFYGYRVARRSLLLSDSITDMDDPLTLSYTHGFPDKAGVCFTKRNIRCCLIYVWLNKGHFSPLNWKHLNSYNFLVLFYFRSFLSNVMQLLILEDGTPEGKTRWQYSQPLLIKLMAATIIRLACVIWRISDPTLVKYES